VPADNLQCVEGTVSRVHFTDETGLFTICVLETEQHGEVTVLGNLGAVHPGEVVRARGTWEEHPRFGDQFRAQFHEILPPADKEAMEAYLCSGLISGVGPATARRIVDAFGEDTFRVLDHEPERLLSVKGISKKKQKKIAEDWEKNQAHRRVMVFLSSHGIGLSHAGRILSAYGADAVDVLRENPYRLAREVEGIGFATADSLAKKLGMPADSEARVAAGLSHVLSKAADQGHFFTPETGLVDEAARLLSVPRDLVQNVLDAMAAENEVLAEDPEEGERDGGRRIYLPSFLGVEKALARRIAAFLTVPMEDFGLDEAAILEKVLKGLAIRLSDAQLAVLKNVLKSRMTVITGGPGTGKTTLIKSVKLVLESLGMRVALAAPTGRAAKRLAEVTGAEASTIHRLLGYDFTTKTFMRDESRPLDQDALIVDEASMVDTFLLHYLFKALTMGSVLILVGDANQLPPVGPGNALRDIIASGKVPVFTLEEVFRQARESLIVRNAHRVNKGLSLVREEEEDGKKPDFYFIEEEDPARVQRTVLALCAERIPDAFGLDGKLDVQVITPMHKGPLGTVELNRLLQETLNPARQRLEHGGRSFAPGDKVMQVKNNYEKEVFNGDIGTLYAVNREQGMVSVLFDNGPATYRFSELSELSPAFAISVHKSQGSEYPAVVFVLSTAHYALLQRNLIYTGITRARKLLVLVGSQKALSLAVANDRPSRRRTMLGERIAVEGPV